MLRQNALILNIAKVLLDVSAVLSSFILSFFLRFEASIFAEVPHLAKERYATLLLVAVPAFLISQYALKMYSSVRRTSVLKEIYNCLRHGTSGAKYCPLL